MTTTNVALSPAQPGMSPLKVIRTYSPSEWEEFTQEWTEGFEPKYAHIARLTGAGDKGRDIVGYVGDPKDSNAVWDNYQCKHYGNALTPTNVYLELGKLCVYTWRGDYTVPRHYRFVAPLGVGTKLHDLLRKPVELKKELVANWDKYCRDEISDAESFPLEGDLETYVSSFDLSIVWYLSPQEILDQHRKTKHWSRRFKIEPPIRPDVPPTPEEVQAVEQQYVICLLNAYASRLKKPVKSIADIASAPQLHNHFKKSRGHFFSADALARFSREQFAPGTFEAVKEHVHTGVEPIALSNHADELACVLAVTKEVCSLQLPASDLQPYINPADRIGICHHLTNEGKLSWSDHARIKEIV